MGKRRTSEEFIELCTEKYNGFYQYNKETLNFKNNLSLINVICPIHGEFKVYANYHLNGNGICNKCNPNSKKHFIKCNNLKYKTNEELIKRLKEVHGEKYDLTNVHLCRMTDKIHPVCKKHNNILDITLKDFINGSGCKLCGIEKSREQRKMPIDTFIQQCNIIYNNMYDYSNIHYSSLRDYIYPICRIHGAFKVSAESHLRLNCGCQKCGCGKHTFSCTKLFQTLKNVFIDAIQEYSIGRLRLDIFIPSINVAIEYQGLQHFKPISFYGGEIAFMKQKERDERKYNLCREKGIKLFYFTDDKRTGNHFLGEKVFKNKEDLIKEISLCQRN